MKPKILLIFIIVLAFTLRFYKITDSPKGIYGDELTLVYDSYSLLKTGHDQLGNPWPIVFTLGGSRPAGYVYATIPFVALFGPGALAARSVSVLSGVGLVLTLFFLGKELVDKKVGLWAAFFTATSPWSLSMSRGGFETNLALFLASFGTLAFIKGVKDHRWLILSALSFAAAMQTYPTYRLTVPLFFSFIFLQQSIQRKNFLANFKKPLVVLAMLVFVGSFGLSLFVTLGRSKDDRFSSINIFADPDIKGRIETKIDTDRKIEQLPPVLSNLFHNRFSEYGGLLVGNYVDTFSSQFLFLSGDKNPRHNSAEIGEVYWVDFVLIMFGITLIFKKDKKILITILGWVLIAPIASSIVGTAHALRSSFLLPPLILFISFGAYQIQILKPSYWKKVLVVLLVCMFTIQFLILGDRLYFLSANKFYSFWSFSAKEAAELAINNKDQYGTIILSNNIPDMEFAYPVYAKLDPQSVIAQNTHKNYINGYWFLKYNNVYIGSIPYGDIVKFINTFSGSVLYIGDAQKEQLYLPNSNAVKEVDGQSSLAVFTKK